MDAYNFKKLVQRKGQLFFNHKKQPQLRRYVKANTSEPINIAQLDTFRPDNHLSRVAFASQSAEPKDEEIYQMIDDVIRQLFGRQGLAKVIKPGDKVIIKVNLVGPQLGQRGEKGRAIITDPRIVRYVAEKVREIIGFGGTADLKIVDGTFYKDPNPSLVAENSSFHWARLERTGDNLVNKEDFCYDYDHDGILDGKSKAVLVNLDSIGEEGRQLYQVKLANGRTVKAAFPKMFRNKEQAHGSNEYCDVLIGIPIFKSHGLTGITGAVKLHYGSRSRYGVYGDEGRFSHDGLIISETGIHHKEYLYDYLCAQNLIRPYDLVIMDCLTGNRKGPILPNTALAFDENIDSPADYILTNAVMASTDMVAIDTVETAFAGYKLESIHLLDAAAQNHLGTNDPGRIMLCGYSNFMIQRQNLYNQYHEAGKYPFENGWGGAEILDSIDAPFQIKIENSHPDKSEDGLYYINYEVIPTNPDAKITLSRVDLMINGDVIKYNTEGNLMKGQFTFSTEELEHSNSGYFSCVVAVWDNIFNFVRSLEMFLKP